MGSNPIKLHRKHQLCHHHWAPAHQHVFIKAHFIMNVMYLLLINGLLIQDLQQGEDSEQV